MPKASDNFANPRRLLLSWRRPEGEAYSNVPRFLDRLKVRIKMDCDHIEVVDIEEAGKNPAEALDAEGSSKNPAEARLKSWTDFFAVWTVHYGLTWKVAMARNLVDHELHRFRLDVGEGPQQGWVAKLEVGFDREAQTGKSKLWDPGRWHELPDRMDGIFPTASNKKDRMDKLIAEAVRFILDNPPIDKADLESADGERPPAPPPAADTSFGTSLSRLSRSLLGRDH